MDQPSGQRADAHHQGGPWRGEGNSYQRSGGRSRGYDGGGSRGYDGGGSTGRGNRQYNRENDRQGYQWNNKQYNQEERQQSGGFGKPSYQQRSNVQQQEDMTQWRKNFNDRARPKDKNYEDHVRDTSPDRQDRSRPKDKNDEDHTRDQSPDRSLPEHCIQENEGSSFDATTSNQSPQVQNTGASSSQGMSKPQQSFDSQNMEWNAQGQGKGQDYRHQHSNRGRGQQHNENWEDTQGQGRDHQNQQYNRNRDDYQNYDRHQQYQRYDDQQGGYGRGKRNQGYSDNKDGYQQGQGYNRRDYQQNDDRRQQRSWLIQLAKEEFKENDVKSTMCIEEEEFPNSSDFVYDLEDSTSSLCTVQEDSLGQRFDQNVKVSKVSIDYANLVQYGKGKKKKNKKSKGDREKEEGTETQKKKDKTEIDETAVEDAEQNLKFNEKMKVDAPAGSRALNVDSSSGFGILGVKTASGSGALHKLKDDYPNTPPNNWEDDDKFEDAIQDQEPEEELVAAIILESYEETITIDEPENSVSVVDYLMEKDVVAVHVEPCKDGFRRIACVTEDKSFIFEVENNPFLMTSGKVAEFFNWTSEPTKVFHGLDSKTCAVFFHKYEIILDGTKVFDLKIAYDMMREYGLGDITKLKKTGFSPDCIPVDTDNVTAVCLSYIKAHQYFSSEIIEEMKDYKKELFTMVKADICKEDLKELRDKKKKEIKAADFNKSKSNKLKKMKDFSFPPLPLQSNKTEINFESERKLKIIPNSDSSSSHSSTFAEYLLKECNSPAINLQAASTHPSLNSTLQQEFNETRQMARQCATQKSQEEQCQVIAVVKHESVDFPDGRRYTCKSTVVPNPVIVEGKSTTTQTESDKCKDVGVQCEIIDWNKYQKMIELAEVLLK